MICDFCFDYDSAILLFPNAVFLYSDGEIPNFLLKTRLKYSESVKPELCAAAVIDIAVCVKSSRALSIFMSSMYFFGVLPTARSNTAETLWFTAVTQLGQKMQKKGIYPYPRGISAESKCDTGHCIGNRCGVRAIINFT